MQARKTVCVGYRGVSEDLTCLFEDFRLMCNDAIRIALQYEDGHRQKVKNRFELIRLAYPRLKTYGLHTHYILSACEIAFSAYRNKTRKKSPYIRKAFIKIDGQSYSLNHLILRIPSKPKHFIYLTLNASDYHLSLLDDKNLKRSSITITLDNVSIALRKEAVEQKSRGYMGLDVNERNITWSDSNGNTKRIDTSEVAEIKARYREIRAKISERTYRDARVCRKLLIKFSSREKQRTVQAINRISRDIVNHARTQQFGITMERLKGIRRLYRRGNGQGLGYRGRMNSWMFHEFQRQIEYKARWEGIPVSYVSPRGTSSKCPNCDSPLFELAGRKLGCPSCMQFGDRDEIASKNILKMACAVPQARPSTCSSDEEPLRQEKEGNPLSRRMEVDLIGRPHWSTEP
jgi:putative transposase